MSHETPRGATDRLLIKPTRWARPASVPQEDKSTSRHTEVARSAQSHSQAPTPILAATPAQTDTPTLTDPRHDGGSLRLRGRRGTGNMTGGSESATLPWGHDDRRQRNSGSGQRAGRGEAARRSGDQGSGHGSDARRHGQAPAERKAGSAASLRRHRRFPLARFPERRRFQYRPVLRRHRRPRTRLAGRVPLPALSGFRRASLQHRIRSARTRGQVRGHHQSL